MSYLGSITLEQPKFLLVVITRTIFVCPDTPPGGFLFVQVHHWEDFRHSVYLTIFSKLVNLIKFINLE